MLAQIMFLIYVSDMPEGINSYISLFADDAKLMKEIRDERDCKELQKDIGKIYIYGLKHGKWN